MGHLVDMSFHRQERNFSHAATPTRFEIEKETVSILLHYTVRLWMYASYN